MMNHCGPLSKQLKDQRIAARMTLALVALFFALGCSSNGSITNLLKETTDTSTSPTPTPTPTPTPSPAICDTLVTSTYGGGAGTAGNPYRICSLSQWNYLATNSADWGKAFKLEASIDFTGVTAATFKSVGNSTTAFSGSFDGGGNKIINLTLTGGASDTLALFVNTDGAVTISNLTLEYITLTAPLRTAILIRDHGSSGTLTLSGITIKNCSLSVTAANEQSIAILVGTTSSTTAVSQITGENITLTLPASSFYSGGLIGTAVAAPTFSNVTITNFSMPGGDGSKIGTLVGIIQTTATTPAATFTDVTITGLNISGFTFAGGIVSDSTANVVLTRVRVTGLVDASPSAGLIVLASAMGPKPSVTITDSSYVGNLPNTSGSAQGGLLGNGTGNVDIVRSYHIGSVTTWSSSAGGLIGSAGGGGNTINITDSFASGARTITHATNGSIAGIMGNLGGGTLNLNRVFYTGGTFTGTNTHRSCLLHVSAGTVNATETYYDSTVCTYGADYGGAITGTAGMSTASLQPATAFSVNWLSSVWNFSLGSYPTLK